MHLDDWRHPSPGRRDGLVRDLMRDLGLTEAATFLVGDGTARRFVIASDGGLLVLDWDPGDGRASWSFSGELVPWREVAGVRLVIDWVPDPYGGGTDNVRRLRLLAITPSIDLVENELHPAGLRDLLQAVTDLADGSRR